MLLLLGSVIRLAGAWPVPAAMATTVVAGCSLGVGYVVNGRHHGAQWRKAWTLIGLALAVLTVSTTWSVVTGSPGDGAHLQIAAVVSACLAGAGVVRLLKTRVAGSAADVVLEGAIIAAACTYVAWAWTAAQHIDHVATALVPIFAWVVVVWLTGRLLFLTPEQIVGYRILAGAFVVLLLADAVYVGMESAGGVIARGQLTAIMLCGYLLWGIAAAHPSMGQHFAPVEVTPTRFGVGKLGAHLALALVTPVALLLLPTTRQSSGVTALVACSSLVPLLLVGYLVRQVRGRASAEYRAQHDELTGLPNRRLFEDRAEAAFRDARRDDAKVAVLFLDLDRFKAINDSLGHAIGNQLLQGVAKRLSALVREDDTVARFGGDEFTVLAGVATNDGIAELARNIRDLFARPFSVGGRELHTRTSIGIALFPDDGEDIDTLLKNADVAMYRAKARGRDAFEFYTPGLAIRARTKLSVESGLRHALEHDTLELHYQPQLDVSSGRIFGLEALARWPHPKIGMIPPDVFVPVAEESNLVVALGEWVLEEACAQARRWLDDGIMARPVAVNISARHFASDGFADAVSAAIERHSIPPGILEIEITESIFMRDLDQAGVELAQLREMGVRCAIDDFGTGFSGLRYLADMSIDRLKIDQSFVSGLRADGDKSPIIDAIVGLGQRLGLDVVAEGVETEEQVAFLVALGCTRMQGYLFGRPQPAHEIARTLRCDDNAEIEWLVTPQASTGFDGARVTTLRPTEDAGLLQAICAASDVPLDIDTARLPALLDALANGGVDVDRSAAFLRMPLRVAAGTCAGLVPLVGGLAAAGALPNSLQGLVAATTRAAGIELPHVAVPPRPAAPRVTITPPAGAPGGTEGGRAEHAPHRGVVVVSVTPSPDEARAAAGAPAAGEAPVAAGAPVGGEAPAPAEAPVAVDAPPMTSTETTLPPTVDPAPAGADHAGGRGNGGPPQWASLHPSPNGFPWRPAADHKAGHGATGAGNSSRPSPAPSTTPTTAKASPPGQASHR